MKKIKNKFVLMIFFLCIFRIEAQTVEKLGTTKLVQYRSGRGGSVETPYGIYVDEINQTITWFHEPEGVFCTSSLEKISDDMKISKINTRNAPGVLYAKLNNEFWSIQSSCIFSVKNGIPMWEGIILQNGISFILKKENGYIVYYVDKNGIPGAVDTEGKIYTNKEAVEYLKQYDSDKYEESLSRAEELGIKDLLENAEVLVWGNRYYSTLDKMKKVLGKSGLILYGLIQYDMQGNAYQIDFDWWGNYKNDWGKLCDEGTEDNSDFVCADVNGNRIVLLTNLNNYSKILGSKGDYQETRPEYSTSWYVGFGGNIYYYIAGEEYTEVFRIRRTWGDPDFYAMAINGYTDDEYGKYVDEVLSTLSKSDLRLLRNTIFALYGVHFKSEDLSKHFDKQVWYIDEGKTSAQIQLPAHRQKLVEMIQKLEK